MSNLIKANEAIMNGETLIKGRKFPKIKVKKLSPTAIIPTRGSDGAAGMDLYANINSEIIIMPHQTVKIGTGLAIELPEGYFGTIFARSGLSTKQGCRPATCVSVIDSDYTGEWIIPLHNDSDEPQHIIPSQRIAQTVILPYLQFVFEETNEIKKTNRGNGGFGSTGKE